MNKRDLILFRDNTENGETKSVLRWAINRIEELEAALRDAATYARAIERVLKDVQQ